MEKTTERTLMMRGVTPSRKRPFTVYSLDGGIVEIINWQGRRARYTASDLDGIVAFIKRANLLPVALWDASGERNPLESYLRMRGLRVFSGCLVAFLQWKGRLSVTSTPQGHIAAA